MFRLALLCILAVGTVVGILFAIHPEFDIQIAALYYDPAINRFILPPQYEPLKFLRDTGATIVFIAIGCALVAVVVKRSVSARKIVIPARATIFLVATLVIGPGLITNGILKHYWPRPRPSEVTELGGTDRFVPWWDPRGGCEKNCSFVSGETSGAAWTLAPAVLVPGVLGAVAVGAALTFTVVLSIQRVLVGGHFFTDTVFAAVFTSFIVWLMYGICFRWTGPGRRASRAKPAPQPGPT